MARPKEQVSRTVTGYQSAAFLDKCIKEKDRVKAKLAQQLREDVLCMLSDEIHTDLTVTNGSKRIQAHRGIFLTRVGSIFPELQNDAETIVSLNNLSNTDLDTLVREVYYVENVLYMHSYRDGLFQLNGDPQHTKGIENGDVAPLSIEEVILEDGHNGEVGDVLKEKLPGSKLKPDTILDEEILPAEVPLTQALPTVSSNESANLSDTDSKCEVPAADADLEQENSKLEDSTNGMAAETDSPVLDESPADRQTEMPPSRTLPYDTCSKLGTDLLRMFLEEIGCDTTLVVAGQEFKAHKYLLAARSRYFDAMFGGLWSESGANKVILEGVSPCAVEQALLYLYGGVIDIIEPCELTELIQVADMYGLEGLKDVVCYHVKKDSCHFYHKPCPACATTAAHALTLSVTFRLEEVKDRTFKWMNKFFTKIVATKQFAGMPDPVLDMCSDFMIEQLTHQTVIDTILECHKLTSKLPRVKWAEPVLELTSKLMDCAIDFTSQHFVTVVQSQRFLSSGKNAAWSVSVLEDIFSNVIDALPPQKACGAYCALLRLQEHSIKHECPWGEDMQALLGTLISYSETYMKHYIHQVTLSPDWRNLPADIRERILKSASYVCIEQDLTAMTQPPLLSNKKLNRDGHKTRGKPKSNSSRSARTDHTSDSSQKSTQVRKTPDRTGLAQPSPGRSSPKDKVTVRSSDLSRRSPLRPSSPFGSAGSRPQSARDGMPRAQRSPPKVSGKRDNDSKLPSAHYNSRSQEHQPPKQATPLRPPSTSSRLQQMSRESPPPKQATPSRLPSTSSRLQQMSRESPPPKQATPSRLPSTSSRLQQMSRESPPPKQATPFRPPPTSSRLQQMSSYSSRVMEPRSRLSLSPSPGLGGESSRSRLPQRVMPSLRPARSTGSLNRSCDLRESQRSVSANNLDFDAWGLRRREYSMTSLDTLVPILETAFTMPDISDLEK
ncbi:BTB/POZ domain-containing protein 8-like [Haliotis asinina]|uniref:BTB/POZ domain-containing protein 8-like n=1 Tax=Haliotis asinina TaxID=109174 RepID=UPI003531C401